MQRLPKVLHQSVDERNVMTSILAHKVLQALLMLATSDICPEAEWYGDEFIGAPIVVIDRCAVPLAPGQRKADAVAYYRAARKLSGRGGAR